MSHWTNYFDKIFLINLPERKDRLIASTEELSKYNIHFQRWEATKDYSGANGLYDTMVGLFEYCIHKEYHDILVFEDDIKFLQDPTEIMDAVIKQMPLYYDLLYLGCNATVPFEEKYSDNLLKSKRSFSSHAVGYSQYAMSKIIETPILLPYDLKLAGMIQPENLSYCVYPMLATQKQGWSDIENRYVTNYADYLENRFAEQTKHLL